MVSGRSPRPARGPGGSLPRRPRAASFDVWLTLIRSNPRFKAERNSMLRAAVAPDVAPQAFADALREADVRADRLAERTGRDHHLDDRLRLALGLLERPTEVLDDALSGALREHQHELAMELPPTPLDPSLPDLLAELAAAVPLAITSNTGMIPASTMRALLHEVGLLESFVVQTFSDETGAAKPDPVIFAATMRCLGEHAPGAAPGDVVHVGDNPLADDAGARAAGMMSMLVGPSLAVGQAVSVLLEHAVEPAGLR
ncbi:HAD family hydrolase [Isoptericola sp. NPDC057191]|uniref:HAD family hydrolase n=1 Tax=Isoptericola sp. NPDC057191 TaxID=3346041 RepID=UPI00363AF020